MKLTNKGYKMYVTINRLGKKNFNTKEAAQSYARKMNRVGMNTRVTTIELV